jgi:hypothetical protein
MTARAGWERMAMQFADMHDRILREERRARRHRRAQIACAVVAGLLIGAVLYSAPAKIAATVHQAEERAAW